MSRNDLCPCGSGRRFQALLHAQPVGSTDHHATTTGVNEVTAVPPPPVRAFMRLS